MKRVFIITSAFLDGHTGNLSIGGLETYMYNLSLACREFGYEVTVFQLAKDAENRTASVEGIECRFVPTASNQKEFERIYRENNGADTVFVIGTDQINIRSKAGNVVTIQHGIAFDIPGYMIPGFWGKTKFLQSFNKLLRCLRNVGRMDSVRNTVCVDYNYYNWYKTLGTLAQDKRVWVIPNFSSVCISREKLLSKLAARPAIVKLVFSRRFEEYRGSLLFTRVVRRLMDEGAPIDVTFAGGGVCRKEMETILSGCSNVHFTTYETPDSVKFHSAYDIAVVPTIYSEGTSFSLCEAMSAGCFPICTFVGGLSNILIDHFNGLLCAPTEQSLYEAIKEALNMVDAGTYAGIVENAYNTAVTSLPLSLWKEKWKKVMESVSACHQ